MSNNKEKQVTDVLGKLVSFLALGTVLLYWLGYVFLTIYSQKYNAQLFLADLSIQDVFIAGVWPILWALSWLLLLPVAVVVRMFGVELLFSNIFYILTLIGLSTFLLGYIAYYLYGIFAWLLRSDKKFPGFRFALLFLVTVGIFLILPGVVALQPYPFKDISQYALSYQKDIFITYQQPQFFTDAGSDLDNDWCENGVCHGRYRKVFETREYLFLTHGERCQREWCPTITVPKQRVLLLVSTP